MIAALSWIGDNLYIPNWLDPQIIKTGKEGYMSKLLFYFISQYKRVYFVLCLTCNIYGRMIKILCHHKTHPDLKRAECEFLVGRSQLVRLIQGPEHPNYYSV